MGRNGSVGQRGRREEKNRESKIPPVYPVETNRGEGKPELVLETAMTRGPIVFKYFLKQPEFLPLMLLALSFCTRNTYQTTTVFNKLLFCRSLALCS